MLTGSVWHCKFEPMKHVLTCLAAFLLSLAPANAGTICTLVTNAQSGVILLEEGDCRTRVTPASTFKIPLSLMGYDAGILENAYAPVLPFKKGYADWGGRNWTQATDPARWMQYSVVWFSQQITAALGLTQLKKYATDFDYGNADFAGDAGLNNALERAWISSSLKIAPIEQVTFLRNLINRRLPVKPDAIDMTLTIIEASATSDGWVVAGKTGAAFPRQADGSFNRAKSWGWFIGWAHKGNRTLVFARLDQDERRQNGSAGIRTKEAFLQNWDQLAKTIP